MKSFRRLLKPFILTSITVGGGYYLYKTYRSKQIMNLESTLTPKPQELQSDIPALLEHHEQNPLKSDERQNLDSQREESIEKHENQIKHQKQTENKESKQIQAQQPQLQEKQSEKNQENKQEAQEKSVQAKINEQQTSQKQSQQQKTSAEQSEKKQTQQLVQQKQQQLPEQKEQPKPSQASVQPYKNIDFSKVRRLSQLPSLPLNTPTANKTVLVVSDIGFTEQFQQKLLETIRSVKKLPNNEHVQVYRINTNNPEAEHKLFQLYKHKPKNETIFMVKNDLDTNFVDIDFQMYMQYPNMIGTYMSKLNLYNKENEKDFMRKLERMSPNESYLLFVYDEAQPEELKAKALLAAKYIEMQLALHHLDVAVKVLPVEANVAKSNNLIPEQKIRPKSLHIIRKHNEFTHVSPNLHLKFNSEEPEIIPYHLLPDIGFHNKRGQVAIQSYLSRIEAFNSLSINTPYVLSLTIDKNRVTTETYKELMETMKQIKRKNKYPEVGIALKFAEVGYLGKDEPENHEFCIKMANVAELQNQSSMHEIQKEQDAHNLGINEQNWLRSSYQYLYPHQAVSQHLISQFIQKVLSEEFPQYYRSDKPSSLQNVHKIVGQTFNQEILKDSNDHFVFEYSDHCPSCKMISPLIGYMNEILEPIPVEQRFDVHVMNCQKNRVKGQVYSPYTPNMNYFKNQWKHTGPVRIGLETIKYGGLAGLYDFCVITKLLKTIDGKKFNQTIQSAKGWDRSQFVL